MNFNAKGMYYYITYANTSANGTASEMDPTNPDMIVPPSVEKKNFINIICFETYECCIVFMADKRICSDSTRIYGTKFSLERAKELTSYGWKLMLSQFINVFYGELRGLIIGKKYSAADLAYYNKGNQFPSLALSNLNTSISTVLFPAMSKVNGDMQEKEPY